MSKLAYLNNNPELLQFPNTGGLERVGGSQIKGELVDRSLAGQWLQHHEVLSRQVSGGGGGGGVVQPLARLGSYEDTKTRARV